MADDWQSYNNGMPPGPVSPSYYAPPTPERRSGTWWKVLTAVVVVSIAGISLWTVMTRRSQPQADPQASAVATLTEETTGSSEVPQEEAASDLDKDGLSTQEEKTYGTNPEDADTDRDGYQDGIEVKNGYNPNGAGRLSLEAEPTETTTEDPNRRILVERAEISGVPLAQVFAEKGSNVCQVTGGETQPNTVTVKVKDRMVRQETPINGSTLVMIVRGKDFFLSGFEGGKSLKLSFDPTTGIASGEGAQVKGGIFASEALILGSDPTSVSCEQANLANSEFEVAPEQLVNPS
jgi:hypothetical protein